MQEVLNLSLKRINQNTGRFRREANHIDHRIRPQITDALAECALSVLRFSVNRYPLHLLPGSVRLIWLSQPPIKGDYLVTSLHEPRNQVGTDMPGPTDNHNAHLLSSP
jgi:hypothetical protein